MVIVAIINRILRVGLIAYNITRPNRLDRRTISDPTAVNPFTQDTLRTVQRNSAVPSKRLDLAYTNFRGIFAIKQDPSQYLQFQFNPEEITDSKEVTYEDRQRLGFDNQDFIWVNGGARILSFTLKLDASEGSRTSYLGKSGAPIPQGNDFKTHNPSEGTLTQIQFLQSLQRPFVENQNAPRFIRQNALPSAQFAPPPMVVFVYGPLYVEGIISSLSITHEEFNKQLIPIRSSVSVTFKVSEGRILTINPQITTLSGEVAPPGI